MFIEKIEAWNKAGCEADVYVSDGTQRVLCYAFPIRRVREGDPVAELYAYGCTSLKKTEEDCGLEKMPPFYGYRVRAEVTSAKFGTAHIGELQLRLEQKLPKDIVDGDRISFYMDRFFCVFPEAPNAKESGSGKPKTNRRR